jgi:hypothetical protein
LIAQTGMKMSVHMTAASTGSGTTGKELAVRSAVIANAPSRTNRIVAPRIFPRCVRKYIANPQVENI